MLKILSIHEEKKDTLTHSFDIKVEDIKEEIKVEESVEDPLTVQQESGNDNLEDLVDYDKIDIVDFKVESNEED